MKVIARIQSYRAVAAAARATKFSMAAGDPIESVANSVSTIRTTTRAALATGAAVAYAVVAGAPGNECGERTVMSRRHMVLIYQPRPSNPNFLLPDLSSRFTASSSNQQVTEKHVVVHVGEGHSDIG
jgi:hypothetical protein